MSVMESQRGSVVKNLPANAGDAGSIPGSGRSPGGRNGNPPQYCCLENSMDRGATVHGIAKNQTRLSSLSLSHTHTLTYTLPYHMLKKELSFHIQNLVSLEGRGTFGRKRNSTMPVPLNTLLKQKKKMP